ncbi:MAG: hypothetical protein ACK46L_13780 [Synechococcaceae cyanobacterium]
MPQRLLITGSTEAPGNPLLLDGAAIDAAVDPLTLPLCSEPELGPRCRRILGCRRDLEPVVVSMLFERFPLLSREEILMIVGLPLRELRHTRTVQEILEEDRLEGREGGRLQGLETVRWQEAAALALRLLTGPLGSHPQIQRRLWQESFDTHFLLCLAEACVELSMPRLEGFGGGGARRAPQR